MPGDSGLGRKRAPWPEAIWWWKNWPRIWTASCSWRRRMPPWCCPRRFSCGRDGCFGSRVVWRDGGNRGGWRDRGGCAGREWWCDRRRGFGRSWLATVGKNPRAHAADGGGFPFGVERGYLPADGVCTEGEAEPIHGLHRGDVAKKVFMRCGNVFIGGATNVLEASVASESVVKPLKIIHHSWLHPESRWTRNGDWQGRRRGFASRRDAAV
jgi:hypothetical protein